MKKMAFMFTLLALVIPQLTFASWWNPLSWFSTKSTQESISTQESQTINYTTSAVDGRSENKILESKNNNPQTSKFYIKYDNSRLRSCASTTGCDVLGYYEVNQEISISGIKTFSDLAEWVPITTTDGVSGFLNKSVLSEKPVVINKVAEEPLVFYIKNDDTPVHSCASVECDITGYYSAGNRTENYDKVSMANLPNWVKIAEGNGKIGYVYKTEISDIPVESVNPSVGSSGVLTFYIVNDNTPIYSCASAQCNITGYYNAGDSINFKTARTLASLSEWVWIKKTDGSEGYVYHTKFSDKSVGTTKRVVTPKYANKDPATTYSNDKYKEDQLKKMNEELQPLNSEWDAIKKAEKEAGCDVLSFITGQQYETCKSFTDKLGEISRKQSSIQNFYLPDNTVRTTSPTTPTRSNTTCTPRNGGTTLDCSTQSSGQQSTTKTQCYWSDGGTVWNCH